MEKQKGIELENLEERKLREIEHSRRRRTILQGYERHIDTSREEQVDGASSLIRDSEAFKRHFANIKYYSITASSEKYYQDWLCQRCGAGTRALDYCCGNGENGIFVALCGADTTGIDISPEGIENARLNAIREGVEKNCKFEVMDAEATKFADNTFDVIVEYGALHHLDLDKAMKELCRIVKPTGEIICIEAMRHNPIIHLYRKLTPHLRTAWEVDHILTIHHLKTSEKYFEKVEAKFFHLAALAAVPFRKTRLFKPMKRVLDGIDHVVLKNSLIGRYAWIMVITMSGPRKGV